MKQEIRDVLGVEGDVLLHKLTDVTDTKKKLNELLDKFEKEGYKCPNDVPESEDKKECRSLLRLLNIEVKF